MTKSKFIIGIDFGTTNSTMAYILLDEETPCSMPAITHFNIPQITAAATEGTDYSLPSFLYFPLDEELDSQVVGISWDKQRPYCVGAFAKERGAELPDRMVASAKSWLCHTGVDRHSKLLPMPLEGQDEGRVSPLDACSRILQHLREAWNMEMKKEPFDQQKVLVTVPASFDPSARQLIQEASRLAGYPEVVLLEEPQAALYAWLHKQGENWRKLLNVGDTLLVIDIGGGTTDFSLIRVKEEDGNLALDRVAVGSHLLLGGDNIDLALAYQAKGKLEEAGHTIDEWQLQKLVSLCRHAKEKLFGKIAPDQVDITLPGRGSRLIGGTLKTVLTRQEVQESIIEGFLPLTARSEQSSPEKRVGLQQVGLPYVQDPRISCQLAKFLSMTGETDHPSLERFLMPTAVLFNGGTMKGDLLRQRMIDLLNAWAKELEAPTVKVLPDPDYDFAVSCGAAYYGLARQGKGIRIRGGTSHSYYVGVESSAPAVPGVPPPLTAVCVAPFGMEEGSEEPLKGKEFALTIGEPATFRFFSCSTPLLSNGQEARVGLTVKNWRQELLELPPIEVELDKHEGDGKTVLVNLTSKVNELGVFELWCVDKDNRKWKLEFDTRAVDRISR